VHQQQVIHRDIKPANLIRRQSDGKLVLIDFGAVKALGNEPGANPDTIAIGSDGYMAPEQQASRPCFASDLYATGMVALQALSGLSPGDFPRDPSTEEITCVALGLTLEPDLVTFLDTLVRWDHRQRFPDAQVALNALTRLSADRLHLPAPTDSPPFPDTTLKAASLPTPPPPHSLPSPLSQQSFRNRQALLNKVNHFWIQGVLERSLQGQVLLTLGLEDRVDAIATPWNLTYEFADRSPQPQPLGTQVIDIFDRIGEGRTLLILGEPGAGKTTTLLTLTRDLLHRAEQTVLVRLPVVFNLSSWQREPIADWLISELNSKYQVPKAIGRTWVAQQQLLLLLDGLDEVAAEHRDHCVLAINQFHQEYSPEMVVCSRMMDYEQLAQKLTFQHALSLKPLAGDQIWQYLNRLGSGLTGLKTLLEQESFLQDSVTSLLTLARSPLILNIMVLAYQGVHPDEMPAINRLQDYRKQLFDAYIARMFQHRQPLPVRYSPQQTSRWLQHLAQQMTQTSQTVFLIERMQPADWLSPGPQRWAYTAGLWLCFLSIAIALGSQVLAWDRLLLGVLVGGILCSRIFGVSRIVPAETLRWDWRKARNNLFLGLTLGPVIGWLLKVGFGLMFANPQCFSSGACLREYSLIGLAFGAMMGLTFGLIRGFSGTRVTTASFPNQGIWQSARNAVLFALIAMITLVIPGGLIGNTKASFWAASGLAFGFAVGGGEALIKHGILRLILSLSGVIPWNYARFLDYATERIFLQKVGGGYIFVHRLLLEHFAELNLKN
jgi:energy-coupling factor transporter ATP-binding protein EcfA2